MNSKKSFNDYSPFKVCRFFKSFTPATKISINKNGSLLLEIKKEKDYSNIIHNITKYDDIEVTLTPHRSLNYSKGVIVSNELLHCADEELETELSSFGVVKAFRIHKKVQGQKIPTPNVILTFERSELPEKIILDFQVLKVRPYEPNPFQCYSCFNYRHSSKKCTNKKICGKCGGDPHDSNDCGQNPKCINCNGPHPAFDRNCPKYKYEKAIEKIKAFEKVSYGVAENVLKNKNKNESNPRPETTYSQAVASPNHENCNKQIDSLTATIATLAKKVDSLISIMRETKPTLTPTVENALSAKISPEEPRPTNLPGVRPASKTEPLPTTSGAVKRPPSSGSSVGSINNETTKKISCTQKAKTPKTNKKPFVDR